MKEPVGGPIFIGGLDRSGTSLIYALLASHPRISMTRRTNWWSYFYGQYGDLGEDANLDHLLSHMARYRRHRRLEPDFDALRSEFRLGPRTYGRLFGLMQAQHAERLGKPRWGDKSLHTEHYADRVFADFPTARMIHMIRDPRDRYASVLKRWKRLRGGVGAATAAWLASIRLAEENARRFPGQYLLLRYEDLASDPEAQLRGVSAFIDEAHEPRMLGMEAADDFRASGGNSSYGGFEAGTISTRSIGRFRETIVTSDVAFIQATAKDPMDRHGYASVPTHLSTSARFKHLVARWPRNLLTMQAWSLRERLSDFRGRSPSPETMGAPVDRDPRSDSAGVAHQESNE
ncbi:MAG: sulfotransferase family protein [Candidatus Limnocylindria bacterium]